MSVGNLKDNGNKGNNFPYQLAVLQLLGSINSGIAAIPGVDYETRTTTFQAIAAGAGYSIGDIIIRYDIIDVATSTIISTLWFNQTTQATIAPPIPADLIPVAGATSVNVNNGAGALAVNIQDGGNSITVDGPLTDVELRATPVPVSISGGAQVLTSSTEVAGGTVLAGATVVSLRTSIGYTGTINGVTRIASNQYIFEAAAGKTLPAIPYTITAGSIDIDKLV